MSEIQIIVFIIFVLAIAYLFIYPRFAGNDIKKMAWLDAALLVTTLLILAPFNLDTSDEYTFFFFDTNWWVFAILVGAVIEVPLFALYVRIRGLGQSIKSAWSMSGTSFQATASIKSVEKQLSDTKWDGLRSPTALRSLVIGANAVIVVGTTFLITVGDNEWTSLLLLYILFLFIFWFLLRQAVRLIPDAPDTALDERLVRDRNRAFYTAYGLLSGVVLVLTIAMFGFVLKQDFSDQSDGFTYAFVVTWPQVQALFWLVYSYVFMSPSMVMAWLESRRLLELKKVSVSNQETR